MARISDGDRYGSPKTMLQDVSRIRNKAANNEITTDTSTVEEIEGKQLTWIGNNRGKQ